MAGNPHDRAILRLAGPALVALLAEPLYLLADTAVVGHLGTDALAGLAVASSILLMAYSLSIFLAYGTTSAVARLLGAERSGEAAYYAVQSLWLAVFVGVGFALIIVAGAEPLVGVFGASGDVATHALVYLRISAVGFPFLLVALAGTGYLRGLQDTRTPVIVALGSATLNLIIEVVLVWGFDAGIGASALSTVIAQVIAALFYLRAVLAATSRHHVGLRPSWVSLRSQLRVGRDLVIRTAALRGSLLVLTAIATRIGTVAVAAHQIAFEIWNLLAFGLDALAIAAQALVGRYLGAGRPDVAREAAHRMLVLGMWASGATTVVMALSAPVLPMLFSPDETVRSVTTFLLWWVAGLQVLGAVAFVLDGVLIGAGDQKFLARAMAIAALLLVAVAIPILPLDLGIGWVWAAFAMLMAGRAVLLLVRFQGDEWTKQPIAGFAIGDALPTP